MKRRKMNKFLKYLLITLGGLLLIVLIGRSAGWLGAGKTEYQVVTKKAKKRTITELVTANGKIQPETDVKISPDVSGEIVELPIKEGDRVEEGDLLARIRPDVYESALNQAEASLNNAKASLANSKAQLKRARARFGNAKSVYERNKKLYEEDAISEAEFQKVKSDYESAKADVEAAKETVRGARFSVQSAEASVKEARDNLEKTSIFAPLSGTITRLQVEKGERVVGTAQMAGTEMMRVSDLTSMEVDVEVNENDIVRVSLDDTAIIEVDAYRGEKFQGTVTEIANAATSSGQNMDQVTNFPVKIRILHSSYKQLGQKEGIPNPPFRPGMSATVDIQTQTVKNTVSVPIRAVTTRRDSTDEKTEQISDPRECVFVHKNGRAWRRNVRTGIQDERFIRIRDGIDAGVPVITAPYDVVARKLEDSTKVTVVEEAVVFKGEEDQ